MNEEIERNAGDLRENEKVLVLVRRREVEDKAAREICGEPPSVERLQMPRRWYVY